MRVPQPCCTRRRWLVNAALLHAAVPAPRSWAATELAAPPWLTVRSVAAAAEASSLGPMALYPDPVLRRRAAEVSQYGPPLQRVGEMLIAGMRSRAITAMQYGVDARVIALRGRSAVSDERGLAEANGLLLVNPRVVGRSDEELMRPWREVCLVLPPGLEVELLRDAKVVVEAEDATGATFTRTLRGEAARAFQHELDHLNGVLIIDHAALDELPAGVRALEQELHAERQRRAYERPVARSAAAGGGPAG